MSPISEERFHDLKDAYALGALPDNEREDFEAYLAAHPERQAEVEDLGGLAGMLAFAPEEHEPPPELRSRLMQVVEAESSVPRIPRQEPSTPGRSTGLRGFALAAAAVLLVGLFSWNLLLQGEVRNLRSDVIQAQGQAEEAQAQADEARVEQAQSQQATAGAQTIQLGGSWVEQGTQAEVASFDEDRVVLVLEDIPEVPEDSSLQIWVIRDEEAQSGGVFEPSGRVTAAAVSRAPQEGDTIAVTVEPAGGSDQPTTTPVLLREV